MKNLKSPNSYTFKFPFLLDSFSSLQIRQLSIPILSTGISILLILLVILHGLHNGIVIKDWKSNMLSPIIAFLVTYAIEYTFRNFSFYKYARVPVLYIRFMTIMTIYSIVCVMATYSAAWGNPRFDIENIFVHLDKMFFAFDWIKFNEWLIKYPILTHITNGIYSMISIIPFLLIGFLLAENKADVVYKFFMFAIITFAIILIVFFIYPTVGPAIEMSKTTSDLTYIHSYFASLSQTAKSFTVGMHSLDGFVKIQDPTGAYYMTGIVSFPSDHAVLAIGFAYFARYLKKTAFIIIASISFLMLISTVPMGNHCIFDVLGGIIVALIGIAVVEHGVIFKN